MNRARLAATLVALLLALALSGCSRHEPDTPAARRAREREAVERIRVQVAKVRGLRWKAPLDVHIVSRAELRRRLHETTVRDERPERDKADEAMLKFLKLIPEDLVLEDAIDELLAAQVVGFYDPRTKELFVAGEANGKLSADTRVTVAHELDHALTDQHYDFGAVSRLLEDADRAEELFAYTALVEGDAVLLQSLWAQRYLNRDGSQGSLGAEVSGSGPGGTPRFLEDTLVFPYTEGLEFAFDRYRTTRSFSAVDAAWRRRPTSSEEILHPERYTEGQEWHAPALADLSPAGCRAVRSGTLGEFDMREVLYRYLSERDANRAADNWAGDSFQFVSCGTAPAFVDRWTADDEVGAGRLTTALQRWARAWSGGRAPNRDGWFSGPDGAGRVRCGGASGRAGARGQRDHGPSSRRGLMAAGTPVLRSTPAGCGLAPQPRRPPQADKLGVKAGQRVALVGRVDSTLARELDDAAGCEGLGSRLSSASSGHATSAGSPRSSSSSRRHAVDQVRESFRRRSTSASSGGASGP